MRRAVSFALPTRCALDARRYRFSRAPNDDKVEAEPAASYACWRLASQLASEPFTRRHPSFPRF